MTKRHFREWYILNIYFYKVHNTLLGLGLLAPLSIGDDLDMI